MSEPTERPSEAALVLRELLGHMEDWRYQDDGWANARASVSAWIKDRTARLRNSEGTIAFDARWKIERDPEDGLVWITHQHCSLTGQGEDLVEAARDLISDMPDVFAAYAGLDDLSEHGAAMVEWLRTVGGFTAPEPTEADE